MAFFILIKNSDPPGKGSQPMHSVSRGIFGLELRRKVTRTNQRDVEDYIKKSPTIQQYKQDQQIKTMTNSWCSI